MEKAGGGALPGIYKFLSKFFWQSTYPYDQNHDLLKFDQY